MRKSWKVAMVTGVAAVLATMVATGPAVAITGPPSAPQGYGFDNHPNLVVAGGSDTTAKEILNLEDLYNASSIANGCHHVTATPGTQNQCDGTTDVAYNQANWDGDTLASANPTGSGSGRDALENRTGANENYEGTANKLTNTVRSDAVTFQANSAVVLDASITTGDRGKLVTSTDANVPKPVYVGTVTAGVSFRLSATADPSQQKDDPYLGGSNAAGTANISRYGCIPSGTSAGPVPDFGRSSSTPNLSGNSDCGNELNATTFWGTSADMIEVVGFNAHGLKLNSLSGGGLTGQQLDNIWSCKGGTGTLINGNHRMTWQDIDPTVFAGDTADIIPWAMNTGSGTYATFRSYVRTAAGDPGFDPNTSGGAGCARFLTGGAAPLENDLKQHLNDPSAGTFGTGADNPENWMVWGSFGVFSAFPYTSGELRAGTFWQGIAAAVGTGGTSYLPSTSLSSNYPIKRILFHVTRKGDADCPAVLTAGVRVCDFTGQTGPTIGAGPTTDLNVTGATSGPGGAVREFTRWLCRNSALQQGIDPFTGINEFTEITSGINAAGFTVVPSGSRTAGSRCQVLT